MRLGQRWNRKPTGQAWDKVFEPLFKVLNILEEIWIIFQELSPYNRWQCDVSYEGPGQGKEIDLDA